MAIEKRRQATCGVGPGWRRSVTEWWWGIYPARGGGESDARAHWPNFTVSEGHESGEGD